MTSSRNWHTIISCQTNRQAGSTPNTIIYEYQIHFKPGCCTGHSVTTRKSCIEIRSCYLRWWTHTSGDVRVLHYHPRGRRDVNSIRVWAIGRGCNCYRINNTIRALREFEVNLLAINKVDIWKDARCTMRHNHSLHSTWLRVLLYESYLPWNHIWKRIQVARALLETQLPCAFHSIYAKHPSADACSMFGFYSQQNMPSSLVAD